MRARVSTRLFVYLVAVPFLVGCGAHRPAGLAQRFIKPGKPAVDLGGPVPLPKASFASYVSQVRQAAASRPASQQSLSPIVESLYPDLASALLLVKMAPTAEHYRAAGEEYRKLGIADAAFDYLTHAVRLDPTDAAAYDGLARIWRDWGYPNLALGDARRAVYHGPLSAAAHNTLGTILQALGQRRGAKAQYTRALALDPRASWALNNLCYLSFLEGELESGTATCKAALEIAPGLQPAHNNLALLYAAAGKLDLAVREFSSAGGPASQFNLGIVYLAGKQYAKAAEAFDAARRARPAWRAAGDRARQARTLNARSAAPQSNESGKQPNEPGKQGKSQ